MVRVVWRDQSIPNEYRPVRYRGFELRGNRDGWTTNMPGDNNIYMAAADAYNAVDERLGGTGTKGLATTRHTNEIRIIGKKNETA